MNITVQTPSFPTRRSSDLLPVTITLASRSRIEPLESRNVVAKLAGSDAALGAEHVVYSAHLDHIGIGAPVDGDKVYNGALDNALGVAIDRKRTRLNSSN